MKILIIGVKGFIGSHCFRYLEHHAETWGCDVFTDYNEQRFFLVDTLGPSYHTLFQQHVFDVCINCAGAASVGDSLKNPERDYELNVLLVYKLLECIRQYNPGCRFINISSAAVYGNPTVLPVKETHPLHPISPYGLHKMYAEQICNEFTTHFSIKTCSLRIFSAFGPGLRKQLFWDLFLKSKDREDIELFGTGEETRDYIFVSDIARALLVVIREGLFEAECYNLGQGIQRTVKECASFFFDCLKWNGKIRFSGHKRMGDPDHWQADITKLKTIGFTPEIRLEEGIRQYAKWVTSRS